MAASRQSIEREKCFSIRTCWPARCGRAALSERTQSAEVMVVNGAVMLLWLDYLEVGAYPQSFSFHEFKVKLASAFK